MGKNKGKGKDDGTEAPKKRGNQGDFKGERLAFLESRLDKFREHSTNKTLQTEDWWSTVWGEYWRLFPNWKEPLDAERSGATADDAPLVSAGASGSSTNGSGATSALDNASSGEEVNGKDKATVMAEIEAKIKCWYGYWQNATKAGKNPFAKWLQQLRSVDDRPPKRLHDYQVYTQDEEKNLESNRVFEERYPDPVFRPEIEADLEISERDWVLMDLEVVEA
ncbi:hypothetical protein C8R46DRAFT_1038057 [Mycena filopes]|nr:hypothetical protein C8R46DRAFT_1038057 [Mycena filopes]